MKNLKRGLILFIALVFSGGLGAYAQAPSAVAKAMSELEKKYEDTDGVMCVTLTKGSGLGMMKMMLNQELGKSFMRGVTSITFVEYSEASVQVRKALKEDIGVITAQLEEFDRGEKKESAQGYANMSNADSGKISDFIIIIEDDETNMVMYMAGDIVVK